MLQIAVEDDGWDVLMVGYNLLNPSARERVLAKTAEKGIGTLGMFAVRRALIDESWLRRLLRRLAEQGEVESDLAGSAGPDGSAGAARGERVVLRGGVPLRAFTPGMDCVLSGTSSAEHLRENLRAVEKGPLPEETLGRLDALFGKVDSISGQVREERINQDIQDYGIRG